MNTPYAYGVVVGEDGRENVSLQFNHPEMSGQQYKQVVPLFTMQKPLTEEQIHNIYLFIEGKCAGLHEHKIKADFPVMLIRAVEEMHGIK